MMNLLHGILAYFYAIALAYLSIAIPNGGLNIFKVQSRQAQLEAPSEKVSSKGQPEHLYLVIKIGQNFQSNSRADHFNNSDHFSNGYVLQILYWKYFCSSILSFLEVVDVKFEPSDIIFPFHYFW
jgi:hypothetical protein